MFDKIRCLKLKVFDGKYRMADVCDIEKILGNLLLLKKIS